ncbi:MAG: Leucyl-tRNA synthetase, mitochondrial [Phylliscum demangeonii]|nr:MAG: Leucyl-tRNA synthetase, mitochondrial [Phylliscum demangeonii]
MFPYPSGKLHLGHLRVYTVSDVIARFKHMQGHEVIHPIGWDAFGLPAENAAIERGLDPRSWTLDNIARMKEQVVGMGGRWDWDREFMTCDPSFYRHTQRLFLLLYERGLAYQAESLVNYDPVDKTVLANEQVDADGRSWRSGAKVQKRQLKQWFFRITAFQEALLNDLEILSKENLWPERVISMQKNWLGKSSGARTHVDVFTTRPDTMVGVQYLALSTTHPLSQELAESSPELRRFLDAAVGLPPDSKAAFLLPGIHAINPLSTVDGMPVLLRDPLPIYVAPYVVGNYAEGTVMGVPGHDVRDHGFWKQNGGPIGIRYVIEEPSSADGFARPNSSPEDLYTRKGALTFSCGALAGQTSDDASEYIIRTLQEKGDLAQPAERWRLRDWLISRQRYWGTPIPIIHCSQCGAVPVPVEQLPVELPPLTGDQWRGVKGNPLEHVHGWVSTSCPICKKAAKRDTDTMDTFVDSSWYFLRFADPHNRTLPFSEPSVDAAMPVDIYVGGVEHAILHLLYARFISKFLATTSLWPSGGGDANRGEPFRRLITQGMVHGKTYSDPVTGRFLHPSEVDLTDPTRPVVFATSELAKLTFEKMSKSKHNGVDPRDCIDKYGADATRAHILFQAPVTEILNWDEDPIVGIHRWLNRVWRVVLQTHDLSLPIADALPSISNPAPLALDGTDGSFWSDVQSILKDISTSLGRTYTLNTAVSSLIKLTNLLSAASSPSAISPQLYHGATCALIKAMAPVTPAFAEECWEILRSARPDHGKPIHGSVFDEAWPHVDTDIGLAHTVRRQACAVQVNGKLRFVVHIPPVPIGPLHGSSEVGKARQMTDSTQDRELRDWIRENILGTAEAQEWMKKCQGKWDLKEARRVIVVRAGQTVNFVL